MQRRLPTDARRAEALATTSAPNSVENSSRGEEAINWTLPSKKAASPGRSDRKLTPFSRAGGGVVAAATGSRVCSAHSKSFDEGEGRGGPLLTLPGAVVHCGTCPYYRQELRRM